MPHAQPRHRRRPRRAGRHRRQRLCDWAAAPAPGDSAPAAPGAPLRRPGSSAGERRRSRRRDVAGDLQHRRPRRRGTRSVTGLAGDRGWSASTTGSRTASCTASATPAACTRSTDAGAATKVKQLSVPLSGDQLRRRLQPGRERAADHQRHGAEPAPAVRRRRAPTATTTLTNPARPPATDPTRPRARPAAGLHEQRQGQRHRHRAVRPRHGRGPGVDPVPGERRHLRPDGRPGRRRRPGSRLRHLRPAAGAAAEPTALATLQVDGTYGLYRINLLTGKAESMGALSEQVTDIAVPLDQS